MGTRQHGECGKMANSKMTFV
jgi:hypothetical protein